MMLDHRTVCESKKSFCFGERTEVLRSHLKTPPVEPWGSACGNIREFTRRPDALYAHKLKEL
jgi:hypothetical protein